MIKLYHVLAKKVFEVSLTRPSEEEDKANKDVVSLFGVETRFFKRLFSGRPELFTEDDIAKRLVEGGLADDIGEGLDQARQMVKTGRIPYATIRRVENNKTSFPRYAFQYSDHVKSWRRELHLDGLESEI